MSYGAAVLLSVVVFCSISAPLLSPHAPDTIDVAKRHLPPSVSHPFGTDDMGRDLLVRVMQGGRISISVGVSAMVFALLIGVMGGGIAGYFGGILDSIVMRMADVMMSIPVLLIILLCSSIFSPGFLLLCLFIGSIQWMEVARVVRSVVLSTRENEYVDAARALGVPDLRILFRHVLPHTSGPVLVAATLGLAQAIMIETTLSFLGFGLQPPAVSWGSLLRNAQGYLATAPWVAIFPGLMIFLTVFCCYLLGDFLKSALDPKDQSLRQNTARS
ncbi:MAG: ABC transporter permease [Candidatus Latescibacterota bacterium]|nr:MAG: ABC transporter permease [Candidatus Latescibacterota bacterium]